MAYKVLVTDKLEKQGVDILKKFKEIEVVEKETMPPEVLKNEIGNYDAVIIRSASKVTKEALENPGKLKVISRAGVGVDNIDVATATEKGIVVMNAPSGNTVSTAELTFAMMISLARKIPFAYKSMTENKWDKKSFVGTELLGKTLGVIGTGRIGTELIKRAKAFGMNVLAYDPFLSEEKASKLGISIVDLPAIYKNADFITVHTPLTDQTRGMIGSKEIAMMKPTVRIINCARGGIVNEVDLAQALKDGKVAGAAIDVFSKEPCFEPRNPLLDAPNVIIVPHLGASTTEAQFNVAVESVESIANFLINNVIVNSVNMPSINKEQYEQIKNFITISEKMGSMVSQLIDGQVEEVELCYGGDITEYDVAILTRAALKGLFQSYDGDSVNYVNAVNVAQARGIKVVEQKQDFPTDFTNLVTIKVTSDKKSVVEIWGSVYSNKLPKIVKYNDYFFEFDPEGIFLTIFNEDTPGVIGKIGTVLGKYKVNIAGMRLGRNPSTKLALTMLNIDIDVSAEAQKELLAVDEIKELKIIKL